MLSILLLAHANPGGSGPFWVGTIIFLVLGALMTLGSLYKKKNDKSFNAR
jgi:hypothetical protein